MAKVEDEIYQPGSLGGAPMAQKMDRVCNMTMAGTMLSVRDGVNRGLAPAVARNRVRRAGQRRGFPVQPGEHDEVRNLLHGVLRSNDSKHDIPKPGQLEEPQVVRCGVLQTLRRVPCRPARPLDAPIIPDSSAQLIFTSWMLREWRVLRRD